MSASRPETLIGNARIVLADHVIERGWVAAADGRIAGGLARALRLRGSRRMRGRRHPMPGMIELHTDHLEAHYVPRPKVFWDPIAAVVSYDAQLATSGITTVLDLLRAPGARTAPKMSTAAPASSRPRSRLGPRRVAHLLRADHSSCICAAEIPMPDVVEEAKES